MAESTSDDQFRILQREIRESIRRNHPNPDRIGCPGSVTLRRMAQADVPPSDPGYRHVMECSPCYEELMEFSAEARTLQMEVAARRRRQTLGFALAVVVVALGIGAYVLSKGGSFDSLRPSPPVADGKGAARPGSEKGASRGLAVAMLNLDSETRVRGEGVDRRAAELQRLPRKSLDLTVNLPRGLEEGMYELELSRSDGSAAIAVKGSAKIEDGLTVLHIKPDLSDLAPGQYHLRIRRESSAWRESEILIF
jgi:hypothetical protein